ncbi:hypothetical protein AYO20_03443 [Fonsecaea nubica]|uniref:Protein kinase domain-containing protein n=1 Tax=Fonsecaea nubica TaxID=856822 RepID=A0A178D6H8_9EURO|nr:hypothetical protein AYO20_03443 [Fonsecaea nubica]OAL37267.1 hypothetical protein AYO20_03443 [Fonsecaea nubica]
MTADRIDKSKELYNLRAPAEHAKEDPGSEYIVQLLDDFLHEGPNRRHQCLVFELLGPPLSIIVEGYHSGGERLDTETILKASTQLLQAVAFMHKAGYAHGDEDDEDDDDIRLVDLGEEFSLDAIPERLAQSPGMQAPQTIVTDRYLLSHILNIAMQMVDNRHWEQMKLDASGGSPLEETRPLPGLRLEQMFDKHVEEPELKILLPVVEGLTRFLPSDRTSAQQALEILTAANDNLET